MLLGKFSDFHIKSRRVLMYVPLVLSLLPLTRDICIFHFSILKQSKTKIIQGWTEIAVNGPILTMQYESSKLFLSSVEFLQLLVKLVDSFSTRYPPWVVSFTFQIVQILVQSHFELVSLVLALEASELVSEPVTQMAFELINNHPISAE